MRTEIVSYLVFIESICWNEMMMLLSGQGKQLPEKFSLFHLISLRVWCWFDNGIYSHFNS